MTYGIREATVDDADDLAQLRWRMRVEKRPFEGDYEEYRRGFARWWVDRQGRTRAVVGTDAGRVVGMGFLAVVNRVPDPGALQRQHGDVQSVFVLPEHRGQGLGSRIVTALVEVARETACDRVNVHSGRRAIEVYERLGFEHAHHLMNLDLRA